MKWQSIAIYLDLSRNKGFFVMWMADMLSKNNSISLKTCTFKSINNAISHNISTVVAAIYLYSTFAELLETMAYFLDFQLTKDFPRKTKNPVIDLLVSWHPTQSLLKYTISLSSDDEERNSPCPGVPFKYLSNLYAASKCF